MVGFGGMWRWVGARAAPLLPVCSRRLAVLHPAGIVRWSPFSLGGWVVETGVPHPRQPSQQEQP